MKSKWYLLATLAGLTLWSSSTACAGQWERIDSGWYYTQGDMRFCNGWYMIDGKWYYFNSAGLMASDEIIEGYYVGEDGSWDGKEVILEQNKTFENNEKSIFETMPKDFIFTSGISNWSTNIEISADGTFVGQYFDEDMGDLGDKYPNGTVYICDFNGKFSKPQQLDAYTYFTELENINIKEPLDQIYYKDNTKYICSKPYGFDDAKVFMIYLPGTPIEHLPDGFRSWLNIYIGGSCQSLPSDFYGLYNVNAEEGFGGWLDEE